MNQADALNFAAIGKDVIIWPLAKIVSAETISLGDSIIIDDFVYFSGGEQTIIGSFVHIGVHSSITGGGKFYMGDFAGLSGGVRIYTGNEDYQGDYLTNPTVPSPYRVPIRSFVRIEKHAIIGANSVLLPGITIGEGVAIGANSLVTKDCTPWTIYVGSPARAIAARPSYKILELETKFRTEIYDCNGEYIPKQMR